MEEPFFIYDSTYSLLYKFYELNDVRVLDERSDPLRKIEFYVLSKGVLGSIKITKTGEAEMYEDDKFLLKLNRHEWELFSPYLETVYYEYLLRTDCRNSYIIENSKNIASEYLSLIDGWNRKLYANLDFFINDINDYDVKDSFSFRILRYLPKASQLLCEVSYSNEQGKLIYSTGKFRPWI